MILLSAILTILKIIGIILLCVFLLLLFVLAVVLFVSFRYNIVADKGEDFTVDVKVSWLFRILRAHVSIINGKQEVSVKALWFNISGKKSRGKGREKSRVKSREKKEKFKEKEFEEKKFEEKKFDDDEFFRGKPLGQAKKNYKNEKTKPKEKGRSIFKIISDIKDKIDYVLNYPDRKKIQTYTIELLADELKALKPKIFIINGKIGFDDPSVTGKLIGLISVISALSGLRIVIKGDFENPVIELCIRIKGKVSVWSILFPLLKYVFKKPIWQIIKPQIFRKGEKNGNSVKQQS